MAPPTFTTEYAKKKRHITPLPEFCTMLVVLFDLTLARCDLSNPPPGSNRKPGGRRGYLGSRNDLGITRYVEIEEYPVRFRVTDAGEASEPAGFSSRSRPGSVTRKRTGFSVLQFFFET